MKNQIKEYTLKEFIKAFREDGYGHIVIDNKEDIKFKEVICDICNHEILEDEENNLKKVVFVLDSYALCEKCKNNCVENNKT